VSLLRITQTTEIKNIFNIYFAFIFSVVLRLLFDYYVKSLL